MSVLESKIGNIIFKNPFIAASGCIGFGLEYKRFFDPNEIGGIALKSLTLKPREGNKLPRVTETTSGMINAIGLENPGLEYFIQNNVKAIEINLKNTVTIANIAGHQLDEYVQLVKELNIVSAVDMIELNVSCPNVENGQMFATNLTLLEQLLKKVIKVAEKPIILKLAPNVPDIKELVQMSEKEGVSAFTLINTVPALSIDTQKKKPVIGNISGGLSGPAIKNIALKCVYDARSVTKLPIIGLGGVISLKDTLEFLMAGASFISIGTGLFIDPYIITKLKTELENYCFQEGYSHFSEIIGIAHD